MTKLIAAVSSMGVRFKNLGQISRSGAWSMVVKVLSTLVSVVLSVVLARVLGAEGFGTYAFVLALVSVLAVPAEVGMPKLVVRETARAQANGDWSLINGLWRWSTSVALAMCSVLLIVGVVCAAFFSDYLPEGGMAVFLWALVLVPLRVLSKLRGAALRGLRFPVQSLLPDEVIRPGVLVILVAALHLGFSSRAIAASDAMLLHGVASFLAFVVGAFLLLRARPAQLRSEERTHTRTKQWVASLLPLAVTSGMVLVIKQTDIIMLGFFVSLEEVGVYRVAIQGGTLVVFALGAANLVLAPHFARLHTKGRIRILQKLARSSARIVTAISIIVFLVFLLFGEEILRLVFGETYVLAAAPLIILCIGQMINALTASANILLPMAGYERDAMWILVAAMALNVTLNFAMIPSWGIIGAAWATAATMIAKDVTMSVVVWRRMKIRTLPF